LELVHRRSIDLNVRTTKDSKWRMLPSRRDFVLKFDNWILFGDLGIRIEILPLVFNAALNQRKSRLKRL